MKCGNKSSLFLFVLVGLWSITVAQNCGVQFRYDLRVNFQFRPNGNARQASADPFRQCKNIETYEIGRVIEDSILRVFRLERENGMFDESHNRLILIPESRWKQNGSSRQQRKLRRWGGGFIFRGHGRCGRGCTSDNRDNRRRHRHARRLRNIFASWKDFKSFFDKKLTIETQNAVRNRFKNVQGHCLHDQVVNVAIEVIKK